MIDSKIKIFVAPTGGLDTNSVIIACGKTCVIFDPDGSGGDWIKWLNDHNLCPTAIYLTHGHYDHMGAVADLCDHYDIPWHMHAADVPIVALNNSLGWMFGGTRVKRPTAPSVPIQEGRIQILSSTPPSRGIAAIHPFVRTGDFAVGQNNVSVPDNQKILSGLSAEFIHTPGHTPGSGMYYFKTLDLLISGDTLFADTVGRTDLPMGNLSKMRQSIDKIKNMSFSDNTRVIPGHGRESNMYTIRLENRFFD